MGCDIHGVLQEKIGERWYDVAEIEDGRDYLMFAALADVRNYNGIQFIDQPRGLPGDFNLEGGDPESHPYNYSETHTVWMGDHSYSWLTLKEINEWTGWDQEVGITSDPCKLREACKTFMAWLEWANLHCYSYYPSRIVFGFDS